MVGRLLKTGDTIGVVSPSHVATAERYAPMLEGLRRLGFRVKEGKNLYKATYGYSATGLERAQDFNDMARDPEVKLVLFGGGEGGNEVVPFLDFGAIRDNPKRYLSYSDGTDILNAIWMKAGLVAYYGQTPGIFGEISEYDLGQFRANLCEGGVNRHVGNSPWRTIRAGRAEGTLVGGYLGNLALMLGAEHFPWDREGEYLLFLEDHEMFSSMDRFSAMLSRVEFSPFMDRVTGLLFGHYSETVPEALYARLARLGEARGIPVAYCDDFGHGKNHAILPIGCRARLDAEEGLWYLHE